MVETGPTPDTKDCFDCVTPIAWLWSPRINDGLGGWVMYERASEDGFTIRSHRCQPPAGPFSYQGSEVPSVEPGQVACGVPTCPDFGSTDFGEGTCPADHALFVSAVSAGPPTLLPAESE